MSNPFESDEDDFSFASYSKKTNSSNMGYNNGAQNGGSNNIPNSRGELLQQQIKQSMNRQLESTNRCLVSIDESQNMGIASAEELIRQREQLEKTEKNVGKILEDTKQSQKHLNSIKSVFGGIKNWWAGGGENKKANQDKLGNSTQGGRDISSITLVQVLASNKEKEHQGTHPALRVRGIDISGFYENDVVEFQDYDPDKGISERRSNIGSLAGLNKDIQTIGENNRNNGLTTSQSQLQLKNNGGNPQRSNLWNEYEKGLETNLNLMSSGLSNLKVLAKGLGEEIEDQNQLLDRINVKVEKSDIKVKNQNIQMKHILGK